MCASYKKIKISQIFSVSAILLILTMFTSCNQNLKDSFSILQGNFYWHQKKYQQAEMEFLQTLNSSEEIGNKEIQQYAFVKQIELANKVIAEELSVRATENLAKKISEGLAGVNANASGIDKMLYIGGIAGYNKALFH